MSEKQSHKIESKITQKSSKKDSEIRQERIDQIDDDLQNLNYTVKTAGERQEIDEQRKKDYESKMAELEGGLGRPLSDESRRDIYKNEVEANMAQAQSENERFDALSIEKGILDYLSRTLDNEPLESYIESPMDSGCKVAVMIPVYDESHGNILRSLSSLAEQEDVGSDLFEVDFVVNNPKTDAESESEAFFANQESIKLLKYINGTSENTPDSLTKGQKSEIDKIKKAGIKVNVIDKSSAITANDENNVGVARNRAGAEIVERFLGTPQKTDGVVAITDCDCEFSPNYIKLIVDSFENNEINGVSGNLEFEIDPEIENHELVKKAFDVYMGIDREENETEKYKGEPDFAIQEGALRSGANMAVNAKSWALAGGMPEIAGGEDIKFGQEVEKLEGPVAKNYGYTITSLMRVSERTGVQGNGRIVKKIKESVDDFVAGKSDRIYVENMELVGAFYASLIEASQNDALTGAFIIKSMKEFNFEANNVSVEEYDNLASEVNTELGKPKAEQDMKKIQELIMDKIYPYYAQRDVTDQIVN